MTDPIVRGSGNVGSRIGRELAGVADFDIREDATEERSTAYLYQIRVDDIVRYIGKGSGRRMYIHLAEAKRTARRCGASTARLYPLRHRRLVEALRRSATITERIIISGLTDRQALALECTIIALFHSDRTGQLWNTIDERFMDRSLLPVQWQDPPNALYRLPRPAP